MHYEDGRVHTYADFFAENDRRVTKIYYEKNAFGALSVKFCRYVNLRPCLLFSLLTMSILLQEHFHNRRWITEIGFLQPREGVVQIKQARSGCQIQHSESAGHRQAATLGQHGTRAIIDQ